MVNESASVPGEAWPRLRTADWAATRDTLHMWLQIVGKIRLAHAPMVNHWWQSTLYVTPRGLGTSSIPYRHTVFDIEFDFCEHILRIRSSDGGSGCVPLAAQSVADFHGRVLGTLDELSIVTRIQGTPNEVEQAIPFEQDHEHNTYDPDAAHLFWRQLLQADRVLHEFRGDFLGKVSPVHFFWGAMDLACTRFSGRTAPPHPGGIPNCADWVMTEAYSHELSSCGFWPGGADEGAFYSYAYPAPEDFAEHPVRPDAAYYSTELGEFLLPYEAVRTAADPDAELLRFLRSTYEAAADLGRWERADLERPTG
ncbi:hypothetical protein D092_21645 [Rhodococcus ruber Chol-4]|uniref:DUF5996 family protein n=1 Tax=Rhodococcus ruber TaxID=1830 RepID=UPI00035FC956|nr:DUF5996 family protein [Rhodococcus ruber]KXF84303.1 hypothetical protein D092_21645 [Rhodococcus ruber Chol-4]